MMDKDGFQKSIKVKQLKSEKKVLKKYSKRVLTKNSSKMCQKMLKS